jgi:putative peptidoglycan lipid II flippase
VPHSVITVSLATALLPALSRAAAAADLVRVRDDLVATQRQALALVLPAAALMVALAAPVAALVFGWGAAQGDSDQVAFTLMAMAPGLALFAYQFLTLRGFYALEDTRTPFLVQLCAVSPIYIGVSVLLVPRLPYPPAAIGVAYSCAYLSASVASTVLLSRRLGARAAAGLGAFAVRLLLAAVPGAAVAGAVVLAADRLRDAGGATLPGGPPAEAALLLVVAGLPGGLVFLGLARLLHVEEITGLLGALRRARR